VVPDEFKARPGKRCDLLLAVPLNGVQDDQAAGVGEGERTKENRIGDGEDRGAYSDSQSHGEDGNGGESRVFEKDLQAESDHAGLH
jgi:hypothetical protein